MIKLEVREYCQNCGDFHPKTEKFWVGEKIFTTIRCEDCVKCEKIYKAIKKWIGDKQNG